MFLKRLVFIAIFLLGGLVSVQSIECTFLLGVAGVYRCHLWNQTVRSEADMEQISGKHLPGFTDEHVVEISEWNSTFLVFPSLLIDKFVNLRTFIMPHVSMRSFNSPITNCREIIGLNLNVNNIFSIPQGIFQNCENLTGLAIASNVIEDINRNAFIGLTRLSSLFLSSNKIRRMHPNVFAQLSSLTVLDLSDNLIEEVHPQWFQLMTNLNVLAISGNNIVSWNSSILHHNSKVHSVLLDRNQIISLDDHTFFNLPMLQMLSVGGLIVNVPILMNVGMLTTVSFNNNLITRVSANSFRGMTNLTQLYLENNQIKTVDFTMGEENFLPHLQILSLSGNRIESLQDKSFSMLVNLDNLYLAKNLLQVLQANSIRPIITQLRVLDVEANRIFKIERELFANITTGVQFRARDNICINNNIIAFDFTDVLITPLDQCFNFASRTASSNLIIAVISSVVLFTFM